MLEYSNILSIMKLTTKEEDYLETIYLLSRGDETVALTDIAHSRGVTLPTVFSALTRLKENGLISQPHYGKIVLSTEGEKVGAEIFEMHLTIRQFLDEVLQLPPDVSEETACKLEHGISPEAVKRLALFINIVRNCAEKNTGCMTQFTESLNNDKLQSTDSTNNFE
jgi:DtxR family Mn-dependent transcriptional regulator